MNSDLLDICNNNSKNVPSDDVYRAFNEFIFSSDIKVIGKLLKRFEFFNKTKHLPGDIIEIGVFKGSGIATFSKFLELYCYHSTKKVIGFDIFDTTAADNILELDGNNDKHRMQTVYSKVDHNELTLESVKSRLSGMNIMDKYHLIKGDVADTLPVFLKENPGLRISMLYIDVDIERPTYFALKYLWDRILPGGIIAFDEYEYHKFSESTGAEKFLKEFNLDYEVISTDFMAPSAYIIKKNM